MGASIRPDDGLTPDEAEFQEWKRQQAQGGASRDTLTQAGFQMAPPQPKRLGVPGIAAESAFARPDYMEDKAAAAAGPSQFGTGLLRSAGQGATFGFGDEITAALRSGLTAETYDDAVADERAKLAAYREAHPGTALAAELVGGLAAGGATGAAVRGTRLGAQAVRGIGTLKQGSRVARGTALLGGGAATGALAGAGTAEGGQRLEGARRGAMFGAGTAGVLGVGSKAVSTVASPFLPRPTATSARAPLIRLLGGETAEDAARGDILKQLGRSRVTLDELQQRAQTALPDEMLLDVGGEALVSRAGGAVATPSTGSVDIRTALRARQERTPKALRGRVAEGVGVQRQNQVQLAEELIQKRRDAARPLYEQAYAAAPIDDPDVLAVFGDDAFQDAYETAKRIAKREGVNLPPSLTKTSQVGGETITEQVPIPVQAFDYVKRGLDDVIERRMRGGGIGRTEARQLRTMLSDALRRVDDAVPEYKAARAQFAGDSALMEAHEQGQKFMSESADDLAAKWPSMTDGERDLYRRGALGAIEDRLKGRTDGIEASRMFRDDLMRDKLRVIFPDDDAFQRFNADVDRFYGMHGRTQAILGNSKTAERVAQQGEAAGAAMDMVNAAATGNPFALARHGLWNALQQRRQGLTEQHVDALAPMLTAQGPDLQALVKALREESERRAMQVSPSRIVTRTAAQAVGARAGSP